MSIYLTMGTQSNHTPAERASWEDLYDQIVAVKSNLSFKDLCDLSNENILILNAQMQIVFVSRGCLNLIGIEDPAEVYGCRTGEMLQCVHSNKRNGCGTAPFCHLCGIARAISTSLKGMTTHRNHRITTQRDNHLTLELSIQTKPVDLKGTRYVLLSLATANKEQANEPTPTRRHLGPPFISAPRTARLKNKIQEKELTLREMQLDVSPL
jgi:hypothetical protein